MKPMRLRVDFNEVKDRLIRVSLRRFNRYDPLRLPAADGDWVELFDEDGETCFARVVRCSERFLTCDIDWDSWRSPAVVSLERWNEPVRVGFRGNTTGELVTT